VQLRVFSSKLNAEEQERQRQLELKQLKNLKPLWKRWQLHYNEGGWRENAGTVADREVAALVQQTINQEVESARYATWCVNWYLQAQIKLHSEVTAVDIQVVQNNVWGQGGIRGQIIPLSPYLPFPFFVYAATNFSR